MARYLESDPIGLEGGLNTYTYVLGTPVNAIDVALPWMISNSSGTSGPLSNA